MKLYGESKSEIVLFVTIFSILRLSLLYYGLLCVVNDTSLATIFVKGFIEVELQLSKERDIPTVSERKLEEMDTTKTIVIFTLSTI